MIDHEHTTSRRKLLNAVPAAMVLAGAGIGAAVAANALQPDAELIRLCAIVVDGHAEMDRYGEQYDGNEPAHVQARIEMLVDEGHCTSEQIADMRAATMEGTKAKARAMMTYMFTTWNGDLLWSGHNELLSWSIARDLLGEA